MRKLTNTEAMELNGGFAKYLGALGAFGKFGTIGAVIGAAIVIGVGAVKAYNSDSMETVNDAVCDVTGSPLPFKKCK